jgi:hypothetical protein
MKIAARILSCEPEALLSFLVSRSAIFGNRESPSVLLNVEQAQANLDRIISSLYGCLVKMMVYTVNQVTAILDVADIAVLDAPAFIVNGDQMLENLLSNYACERLYHRFAFLKIFHPAKIHAEEGLPVAVPAMDNESILTMMENNFGLLQIVDECISMTHSSGKLLERLQDLSGDATPVATACDSNLDRALVVRKESFTIRHYADAVEYVANGFANPCQQPGSFPWCISRKVDFNDLSSHCVEPCITKLLSWNDKSIGHSLTESVSSGICNTVHQDLDALVQRLGSTHTQYVRCICPNRTESSIDWDDEYVCLQLRAQGIADYASICSVTYDAVSSFVDFFKSYAHCLRVNAQNADVHLEKCCVIDEVIGCAFSDVLRAKANTHSALQRQPLTPSTSGFDVRPENLDVHNIGANTVDKRTSYLFGVEDRVYMKKWKIAKRYSEIKQLDDDLRKICKDTQFPALPSGRSWGRKDDAVIAERQTGLESYLQCILLIPAVLEARELEKFLTPEVKIIQPAVPAQSNRELIDRKCVVHLLNVFDLPTDLYLVGRGNVFLRSQGLHVLNSRRNVVVGISASQIQRVFRGFMTRKQLRLEICGIGNEPPTSHSTTDVSGSTTAASPDGHVPAATLPELRQHTHEQVKTPKTPTKQVQPTSAVGANMETHSGGTVSPKSESDTTPVQIDLGQSNGFAKEVDNMRRQMQRQNQESDQALRIAPARATEAELKADSLCLQKQAIEHDLQRYKVQADQLLADEIAKMESVCEVKLAQARRAFELDLEDVECTAEAQVKQIAETLAARSQDLEGSESTKQDLQTELRRVQEELISQRATYETQTKAAIHSQQSAVSARHHEQEHVVNALESKHAQHCMEIETRIQQIRSVAEEEISSAKADAANRIALAQADTAKAVSEAESARVQGRIYRDEWQTTRDSLTRKLVEHNAEHERRYRALEGEHTRVVNELDMAKVKSIGQQSKAAGSLQFATESETVIADTISRWKVKLAQLETQKKFELETSAADHKRVLAEMLANHSDILQAAEVATATATQEHERIVVGLQNELMQAKVQASQLLTTEVAKVEATCKVKLTQAQRAFELDLEDVTAAGRESANLVATLEANANAAAETQKTEADELFTDRMIKYSAENQRLNMSLKDIESELASSRKMIQELRLEQVQTQLLEVQASADRTESEQSRKGVEAAGRHEQNLRDLTLKYEQQLQKETTSVEATRGLHAELDFARTQLERRTDDRDSLQDQVCELQEQIAGMKTSLKSADVVEVMTAAEVSAIESASQDAIRALQEELSRAQREINTLSGKLRAIEADTTSAGKIKETDILFGQFDEQVKQLEQQLQMTRAESQDANQQIVDLQAEELAWSSKVAELQNQVADLEARMNSSPSVAGSAGKTVSSPPSSAEKAKLKLQAAKLKDKNDQQVGPLEAKVAKLQYQLDIERAKVEAALLESGPQARTAQIRLARECQELHRRLNEQTERAEKAEVAAQRQQGEVSGKCMSQSSITVIAELEAAVSRLTYQLRMEKTKSETSGKAEVSARKSRAAVSRENKELRKGLQAEIERANRFEKVAAKYQKQVVGGEGGKKMGPVVSPVGSTNTPRASSLPRQSRIETPQAASSAMRRPRRLNAQGYATPVKGSGSPVRRRDSKFQSPLVRAGIPVKVAFKTLRDAVANGSLAIVQQQVTDETTANMLWDQNDGATLLHAAAFNGNSTVVQHLLQVGAEVDAPMSNGATALFAAAQENHAAVIVALVKAGAFPDRTSKDASTPIYVAAWKGTHARWHHTALNNVSLLHVVIPNICEQATPRSSASSSSMGQRWTDTITSGRQHCLWQHRRGMYQWSGSCSMRAQIRISRGKTSTARRGQLLKRLRLTGTNMW